MRRTSLSLLILLALVAGACSDDSGPRLATIDELRVVKVSGDQSTPVLGQGVVATIRAPAGGLSLQISGEVGEYTPEPLIGRVEPQAQSRGSGVSGPSSELIVPVGTLVHWDLPAEAGRLLAATTATDDSAYIVNRYAPGTKAGAYHAKAQRITSTGDIVTDATWTLIVEPGAAVRFETKTDNYGFIYAEPGDTLDGVDVVLGGVDQHGNDIDAATLRATVPDSLVRWWWCGYGQGARGCYETAGPAATIGTGWTIVAPPVWDGEMAGLRIWLQGSTSDYPAFVKRPGT